MSVRRLDPAQPDSPFSFSADNLSWARATIGRYPAGKQASAVIPLLWRAQEQNAGWVSRPVLEYIADMLGMAYIRVLEVATFYTMFQLSPVGTKAHVQVCGTTPCMLRGAGDLIEVCRRKIHDEPHHRNADGTLSWEEVECLGACVNAPMVQVWKDTYEDLTPKMLEDLIDAWASDKKTTPGPQNGRANSMALGGASTLIDKAIYRGQRSYTRQEAPPPPPPASATPVAAAAPALKPKPKKGRATRPTRLPDPPKPVLKSAPKAIDGRPELLKKAIGKADDLKLIRGVGPALEKLLNKIGVWHFDQIANWSPQELAWIDDKLEGFKGRAKRDEWIRQAKKLATEGRAGRKAGKK